MTTLDRRRFLQGTAAATGLALAGPFNAFLARAAGAAPSGGRGGASTVGYGPLRPTPAENDGVTYLALPTGFSYTAFGHVGSPMADGTATPPGHDGMAAFAAPGGKVVLVRNHELGAGTPFAGARYDAASVGGTTNLLWDPADPANPTVLPSLSGTQRNCAGGRTPWGSWLTCEETTGNGPASAGSVPHGYVFDVPAALGAKGDPTPLKAMGRFSHEAVAIDPGTRFVYETEDAGGSSGFYLFAPGGTRPDGRPDLRSGDLHALAVVGRPQADLFTGQVVGADVPVAWVRVDPSAVDAPATAAGSAPFANARAKGAAAFRRLEGAWWSAEDRAVYFTSTDGGEAGAGQVWAYRPSGATPSAGGVLTLVFESPSRSVLFKPDNLTVTPGGGVLLCEDPDRAQPAHMKGLTPDGVLFDLARNVRSGTLPGSSTPAAHDELAGATFSPDGKVLFVNIQTPGVTFAIRGPWSRGEL